MPRQFSNRPGLHRLALGWLLNHFFFTALILCFLVYGCQFEELSARRLAHKAPSGLHAESAPPRLCWLLHTAGASISGLPHGWSTGLLALGSPQC